MNLPTGLNERNLSTCAFLQYINERRTSSGRKNIKAERGLIASASRLL